MANILARSLIGRSVLRRLPSMVLVGKRSDTDFCADKIGDREIVGYGWNGCPSYADRIEWPFPAIRFREPNAEICALREKEKCDWKKLTLAEKRCLYRYSFCQTFAEMKAPTGEWKFCVGLAFWIVAMGISLVFLENALGMYDELPPSFEENSRRAQLKRMLDLEVNPVQGLSSKWDYEKDQWK